MKKGTTLLVLSVSLLALMISAEELHTQNADSVPKLQKAGFDLRSFIMTNLGDTNKYFFEMMLVLVLAIYVLNYFLGKRLNEKYALLWVQQNKRLFDTEFSHVGVSNAQGGALLDAESANAFKFYASGRQNCSYALVSIEFKKRQDLLSMLIFNLIWPEKDRIRIEIPIELGGALPFVFAVVRRKEAKFVQTNYPDIKTFCRKMASDELGKQYVVLGENEETTQYILSAPVISVLKKHENVIEMISFTDLKPPHKQVLRADLVVPQSYLKNPEEFQTIIKMLLYLVDHVTHYKMSSACRTKAEKERQAYENLKAKESQKEKNEEIQKKLLEKKKELAGTKKKDEKKEELKQRKKMQRKFVKMV